MRVLFVCSGNGELSPFIKEQEESLRKEGVQIEYFKIKGNGFRGYLKNYKPLVKVIKEASYDLIHAHYGLSGLLCTFQNILPTVVTFHGSDVNKSTNRILSFFASRLSRYNIIVNKKMAKQLSLKERFSIIPCGVNFNIFHPINQEKARRMLGLDVDKKYILFSSAFDNPVKNSPLAKQAVQMLDYSVELIELKNKSRHEVSLLLNACDLLLMTSFTEGSPQVVKEALACNTPVVSTDVGDVKALLQDLDNCHVTTYEPKNIAEKVDIILNKNKRNIKEYTAIQQFDLQTIAKEVKDIYKLIIAD